MSLRTNLVALFALVAATVLFRLLGPSDIYEKTQPKTMAYTADMAANGRYLLPRDATGAAATKPPLYNWLALPFVGWLGATSETAHKAPALLAGAVLLFLTIWMARRILSGQVPGPPLSAALTTGCIFVASPETFKWIYIARPDGLLMALLAMGWASSTAILEGWARRRVAWAATFWLSLGAGVLAKGPVGLLPLVYAAVLARVRHGSFGRLKALHCWWGVPVAALLIAAWAVPAYMMDPEHCREIFLGRELVYHVAGDRTGGPVAGLLGAMVKSPLYFLLRFMPWSLFVVIALTRIGTGHWASHPLGPAILWCAVVVVTFCFVAMVKHRYLAPAYPAAAIIAVYGAHALCREYRRTVSVLACMSLITCIGLGVHNAFRSNAARLPFGDAAVSFARQARGVIDDGETVFLIRGNSPVQALMGENQVGELGSDVPADAEWVVGPMAGPVDAGLGEPVLISDPMPRVIPGEPNAAVAIALFRYRHGP